MKSDRFDGIVLQDFLPQVLPSCRTAIGQCQLGSAHRDSQGNVLIRNPGVFLHICFCLVSDIGIECDWLGIYQPPHLSFRYFSSWRYGQSVVLLMHPRRAMKTLLEDIYLPAS